MLQQLLLNSSNNNTVTCRNLEVDVLHVSQYFASQTQQFVAAYCFQLFALLNQYFSILLSLF